jgi:RNA polymerase sigma-70 factor (ECF subfamily)
MDDDLRQHLSNRQWTQAFEGLLERYRDKVFRLAWSFLQDQTAAEDATQDIFVRIWKALATYNGRASLSTWIYTIARNHCFTELRRRRATVSLSDPDTLGALESLPEFQSEDNAEGSTLDAHHLLGQLPEKYRTVISLFYLEQRSYEEVAARLDLPLGTVKTYIHRARRELLRLGARTAPTLPVPEGALP